MIYDKLCNLDRCRGLFPALDRGIDFLQIADLSALVPGRVEIAGDEVYGNHFAYRTAPFEQDMLFEDHKCHLDLHIVLSGCEKLAVAPTEGLEKIEVREDEDAVMYRGCPEASLTLGQGKFLLVFPGEAHLPKLATNGPEDVDKLVLKIAL